MIYRICPCCGANLDPGETCMDCQDKKKTAPSADDTQSGKAKQESDISNSFALSLSENEDEVKCEKDLFERATGYIVLENDIPAQYFFAGDRIYFDNDPQTTTRLVIGMWDNTAHICQREPSGRLLCWCCDCMAPADAVVFGGVLGMSRAIHGYKEATV